MRLQCAPVRPGKTGSRLAAAALLLAALAISPPARPEEARRRAIFLSFDGLGGARLSRVIADTERVKIPAFRRMAREGFWAVRAVPPTPSLTAVSHVTMLTGAWPDRTGIVSNWLLDRSKPFPTTTSGFDAPIRAETMVQAAARQGRRTGVIFYPAVTGNTPERTADFALNWPDDAGLSRAEIRTIAASEWGTPGNAGNASDRLVRIKLGKEAQLTLVAQDSTNDGAVNYDRLRVSAPKGGPGAPVAPGDWFPVEIDSPEGRTGAWCRVLEIAPDLAKTRVYVGRLGRNAGYPKAFVAEIDEKIGFWPGVPDSDAFGAKSDSPEIFLEQAARLTDFIQRALEHAAARDDWDLLLAYQPLLDEVGHEFLLEDSAQPGYSAARAARFAGFYEQGFVMADGVVERLLARLSPRDGLFLGSDHGMTPIWSVIYPNVILRDAGLLKMTAERRADPSSVAYAIASGATIHVYLNPAAPPGTLEKVEKAFSDLRVRAETPWDVLLRRSAAAWLGLDAPESGDLIVIPRRGFHVSGSIHPPGPIADATHLGTHGYRSAWTEVQATFLGFGAGISPERLEQIDSREIPGRIFRWMGLAPPRDAVAVPAPAAVPAR
jgi:predicted AlkP superfamily pyrophosphatase or phosphodiesterase